MAAYRRVYDSCHLQADCQKTGISSGTLRSVIEYGLLFFLMSLRSSFETNNDDVTHTMIISNKLNILTSTRAENRVSVSSAV